MAKINIRLIPLLVWMYFIFYLSSGQTTAITGTSTERFVILKSFHLIEYAILFICFKFAGYSNKQSIIFSYIYALTDEFHQSFVPGRSALIRDTFIDLLGSVLAHTISSLTLKKNKDTI